MSKEETDQINYWKHQNKQILKYQKWLSEHPRGSYRIPDPNQEITRGKRNFNLKNSIKGLLGINDLRPEEQDMYNEILEGGYETTPKRVRMYYPDKEKAIITSMKNNLNDDYESNPPQQGEIRNGIVYLRKKKSSKSKSKRKPVKKCKCKSEKEK